MIKKRKPDNKKIKKKVFNKLLNIKQIIINKKEDIINTNREFSVKAREGNTIYLSKDFML